MNIFCLDESPQQSAIYHTDKHVVKMIVETAQLLSTAHRLMDGIPTIYSVNGKSRVRYVLSNETMEDHLYRETHVNHPSAIWARYSVEHYTWLHRLLVNLLQEYTYRYDKIHAVELSGLSDLLRNVPVNLGMRNDFTLPTPCMPDQYKVHNSVVDSYRNLYFFGKRNLLTWTRREIPGWIVLYNKDQVGEIRVNINKAGKTVTKLIFP